MHTVAIGDAPPYRAAGHMGMLMRRLQGLEAGPADALWIGLSLLAPGGGTTSTASTVEKFYVVIEGEVEITATQAGESQTAVLSALDSCRIAPGEERRLRNPTQAEAKILLVMPRTA